MWRAFKNAVKIFSALKNSMFFKQCPLCGSIVEDFISRTGNPKSNKIETTFYCESCKNYTRLTEYSTNN